MKKILLTLSAILICTNAMCDWHMGDGGSCFVNTAGRNNNYYCGNQSLGCAGKGDGKFRKSHWYYHGNNETLDGKKYWCCNGTGDATGVWTKGEEWYKDTGVRVVQVEGGTCNWDRKLNICGQDENPKCTEPDECYDGLVLRNKQCIPTCQGDTAFPDLLTNECIPCPTTEFQGIIQVPAEYKKNDDGETTDKILHASYPRCLQCNSATHFFEYFLDEDADKKPFINGRCTPKTEYHQNSKDMMKSCFQCTTKINFKICTNYMRTKTVPSDNDNDLKMHEITWQDVVKDCRIKTDNQ